MLLALCGLAAAAELDIPRVPEAAIVVNGVGDEPAWAAGLSLPDALPFQPSADGPVLGRLATTLLADDDTLYVRFVVTDPEPSKVRAGLGRRDARYDDDLVGLYLDPSGEGRRAWAFIANPLGVQLDGVHYPDSMSEDFSWDADWRSAGRLTDTGYEVEMAIPWAALHASGALDRLGVMSLRYASRIGWYYAWPPVPTGAEPLLSQAHAKVPGTLPRRLGLELRPELTGAWSEPHVQTGRLEWMGLGPGLTVHAAPSPSFGAAATFNPDFSQLESDASRIDVNLRYALSYEEKRPFFLEGQDWFAHPMNAGAVYTRSMNAPLAGVRATGAAGPVGLAALSVLDMAPPPSVSEGGGWTPDQLDGHAAIESLGRARLSLGGDSYLGLLASDRSVLDTDLANRVGGLDGQVRVGERGTVEGALLASHTTLPDPTTGAAGRLDLGWHGEHLFLHTRADAVTEGFRQENGFFPRADFAGVLTEDHWRVFPEQGPLSMVAFEPVDVWLDWRMSDGSWRERGYDPSVWAVFDNGAFAKLDGHFAGEEFEGVWIDARNAELYLESAFGEGLRLAVGGIAGTSPLYDPADPRTGRFAEGWVEIEVQPLPRLVFGLDPVLDHMTELDGAPVFTAWTTRARVEAFLTRSAWVRVVADVEGDAEEVTAWRVEPVAAVEWAPGRAVYAGGAWGVDGDPWWQVFAKAGWVFRL